MNIDNRVVEAVARMAALYKQIRSTNGEWHPDTLYHSDLWIEERSLAMCEGDVVAGVESQMLLDYAISYGKHGGSWDEISNICNQVLGNAYTLAMQSTYPNFSIREKEIAGQIMKTMFTEVKRVRAARQQ